MQVIKIRRGLLANLPATVAPYEILYVTDINAFYIGDASGVPKRVTQDVYVGASAPANPLDKQIWIDTDDNRIYRYDSGTTSFIEVTAIDDALTTSTTKTWSIDKIKSEIDSAKSGLDVKESVRVATTAELAAIYNNAAGTLTASAVGALGSIDSVAVAQGDRVLVKNQVTDPEANGIYVVTSLGGAADTFVLTRATDANTSAKMTAGMYTFVEEGTANGDAGFVLTTDNPITLGTTELVFTQFSGAGQIIAGAGLSKTGNQLDVNVDGSTIEINSDILRVKADGITATQLASNIDMSSKGFKAYNTARIDGVEVASSGIALDDYLRYDGTKFVPTNVFDGGTFS